MYYIDKRGYYEVVAFVYNFSIPQKKAPFSAFKGVKQEMCF